jgi:hypothetical protein
MKNNRFVRFAIFFLMIILIVVFLHNEKRKYRFLCLGSYSNLEGIDLVDSGLIRPWVIVVNDQKLYSYLTNGGRSRILDENDVKYAPAPIRVYLENGLDVIAKPVDFRRYIYVYKDDEYIYVWSSDL